jgi:hypothetical protein
MPNQTIKVAGFNVIEPQGSGEYHISDSDITASRKFVIESANALAFAFALKGQIKMYGDFLLQQFPSNHPILPGLLYVSDVHIKPMASAKSSLGPNNMIYYTHNVVEVNYSVPRTDEQQRDEQSQIGIWFTEDIDYAMEVLVIPGGKDNGLQFQPEGGGPIRPDNPVNPDEEQIFGAAKTVASGPVGFGEEARLLVPRKKRFVAPSVPPQKMIEELGGIPLKDASEVAIIADPLADEEEEEEEIEPVKQDLNIFIGSEDISLEFPNSPFYRRNGVRNMIGKTNNDNFLECNPGKLLFMGAKSRREFNVATQLTSRSLTLLLKWRQYDWNREWKPKTKKNPQAGWQKIVPPLYFSTNFNTGIRAIFS